MRFWRINILIKTAYLLVAFLRSAEYNLIVNTLRQFTLATSVIMFLTTLPRERNAMTENERELIDIIRTSDDPADVAQYFFTLFLDYLRTHAPSQETPSAAPQESA